ncbi:ventricular natriuretic peptide-like [Sceloporus undulatus]|uniref:ventricular natriuretic peptide-like n=1 Tax=Sceloporus undulatus TaxID=8520 RepID=UPI001C4AEEE5|nr:ventricular natriuretic peptide-like [Sceloporus undulatus]
MNDTVLHCWASLVAMFFVAGLGSSHPVTGSSSNQELQSLEDLLQRLKEKFELGELGLLDYGEVDVEADGTEPEPEPEPRTLLPSPLRPQLHFSEAEIEEQWRKFFASPKRRRYFSGCFGTRLERIGTQTGLGCNFSKGRSWRKRRS